jgi:hypothetical protein
MTLNGTSLYRCPACGKVVRYAPGRTTLACLCDALPFGSDPGNIWFPGYGEEGGGIGPPRPYHHDREHTMTELEDDGRDGVEDLRDGLWFG